MPPPAKRSAQAMTDLTMAAQKLAPTMGERTCRAAEALRQLAEEKKLLKKAEVELKLVEAELKLFMSDVKKNQGQLLRNFLNKIFKTSAFSQFIQYYVDPLVKSGKTKVLQTVNADFPELPPLDSKYDYFVPFDDELNNDYMWRVITAPPFLLLNHLLKHKDLLTSEYLKKFIEDQDPDFAPVRERLAKQNTASTSGAQKDATEASNVQVSEADDSAELAEDGRTEEVEA